MMNREELRANAASRRSDGTVTEAAPTWHCEFCLRDWQTENGFMKHFCKEREKLELAKSPLGQAAYGYYGQWLRNKKRSVPAQETFMTSRTFNHFVKFAEWVTKLSIPNPTRFIELMVETDTPPMLWCRDTTYALYVQWYDSAYPPESQFVETLDALKRYASDLGCELKDVFAALGISELTKLARRRKLSPWLLLSSPSFLRWIQTVPPADRENLNQAVDFMAYVNRINARPDLAAEFRSACEQEAC
jgi:hypothetical protein